MQHYGMYTLAEIWALGYPYREVHDQQGMFFAHISQVTLEISGGGGVRTHQTSLRGFDADSNIKITARKHTVTLLLRLYF